MTNLASDKNGGSVAMASSYDEDHPPEAIIDDNDHTFWSTTGLFPQEFIIELPEVTKILKITTTTANVKMLTVERCENDTPTEFETVFTVELADREGKPLVETHQLNRINAKYLKFIIESGYDNFCMVNSVQCFSQ